MSARCLPWVLAAAIAAFGLHAMHQWAIKLPLDAAPGRLSAVAADNGNL